MRRQLAQAAKHRTPAAGPESAGGGFVELDGEPTYRISAYDRLAPFLMTLASDADLWMFVTSGGGLTAGRIGPDGSLFPYLTADQLHDAHHHTGPLTLFRLAGPHGAPTFWQPFGAPPGEHPAIARHLYKDALGCRIVFEEIEHALGLRFRYRWAGCDEFGWVRTATLQNTGSAPVRVELLDGLRNILPHGAPLALQQRSSNLVDAYKKNEIDAATGLGIFSLTAGITDKAEALEVLRANIAWCCGLVECRRHLSLDAISAFRRRKPLPDARVLNGRRGHFLASAAISLEPGQAARWHLVADVGRDHVQIAELRRRLRSGEDLAERIDASLARAASNLRRIVATADGLQLSGRPEAWTHHFANVLFNSMRGGVFAQNHEVEIADFLEFLAVRDRPLADRHRERLAEMSAALSIQQLRAHAHGTGDPHLERLVHEYLPLYFGRRHGDPSRPWNQFTIRVRKHDGQRALHYEGNWRDIFQNWEALGESFPAFLPNMVAKFVNASTVDGFNPYRLSRDGVDWETPAPEDPWRNIGYWGDHQIVYLLRLLEALHRHDPAAISSMLGAAVFSYADVPYRLKPYVEMLQDPRSTIVYDTERAALLAERVARRGTDGKLLTAADGTVYQVNLLEKLLVPALSKLSNLVPDAGIWLNTQRPEWNDANNALAGGGASVVTLCYLRKFLAFLADICREDGDAALPVSTEVADWFDRVAAVLRHEPHPVAAGRGAARGRRRLMDALGDAFCAYRRTVYARGFSGQRPVARRRVADLCQAALAWIDRSIEANRRADGLYHTYNLLVFAGSGAEASVAIDHLPEMLEGQVAVLASGALEPAAGLAVLDTLFASALYRDDQRSFMLYPERDRPGFLARNLVPDARVLEIPLLMDLLAASDRSLLVRDASGTCRFHAAFREARDLDSALDDLARRPAWAEGVARDRAAVHLLFEEVFQHRSYLGRAGVMYGYEGIGCIYWHMVAKLLLATQELVLRAEREDQPAAVRRRLAGLYFRIRSGIGYEKSAAEYGAFPTDPYSHTPAGGGAQQPGMTGQVKEEILSRFGELGVRRESGTVAFQPVLLQASEFLSAPAEFSYIDLQGRTRVLPLGPGSLAFTLCQVPVIYEQITGATRMDVEFSDGSVHSQPGATLDGQLAAEVFARSGRIAIIRVGIPADLLR